MRKRRNGFTLFILSLLFGTASILLAEQGSDAFIEPFPNTGSAVDAKGKRHTTAERSGFTGQPPWIHDRITAVAPDYPFHDRAARHEGHATIQLVLDVSTGRVTITRIIKSTGFATLDACALDAFRQWRWRPGRWREIEMPVTFQIGTERPPRGAVKLLP